VGILVVRRQPLLSRGQTTNVRGTDAAKFRILIREVKRKLVHIHLRLIQQITINKAKLNSLTHPSICRICCLLLYGNSVLNSVSICDKRCAVYTVTDKYICADWDMFHILVLSMFHEICPHFKHFAAKFAPELNNIFFYDYPWL
jgi:hypothetical protein